MRHNLIETLTQLQHLSPDDIVNHMSDRGWVRGGDFTLERIRRWHGKLCRVWYKPVLQTEPPEMGDCGLFEFTWENENLTRGLPNHWFILEKHFNGEYPNVD